MVPSRDLAARFEAYSDWRRRLSAGVSALHDWLQDQDLADAQVDLRVQQLLERLHQDKLVVAFVAEFSRGKSELINAIFFADFGAAAAAVRRPGARRCARPSSCTTPSRPPSIRLLPIETRLKDATVAEFKNYADEWVTFPLDLSSAEKMGEALSRVSQVKRVPVELARKYGLYGDGEDDILARARARRRGQRRHPVLAPRGHQLPASAAAAGPRDPRHAGPERDRHRARAHAQPAAERARAAVHPGRRRRRHQDRPRGLEPAPRRRRRRDQGRPHRDPQQDRRPVGRPEVRGARSTPRSSARCATRAHMLGIPRRRRCSRRPRRRRCSRRSTATTRCSREAACRRSKRSLSQKLIPAKRDIVGAASQGEVRSLAGERARDPRRARSRASREQLTELTRAARQEPGRRRAHDGARARGEGAVRARPRALHGAAQRVHAADERPLRPHRPRGAARATPRARGGRSRTARSRAACATR